MLDRFGLWDDWRTQELSCGCGWSGLGEQSVNLGSLNHLTGDRYSCPTCSTILFLVDGATFEETEEAMWRRVPAALENYEVLVKLKAMKERYLAGRLMSREQLPELTGQVDVIFEVHDFPYEGEYPSPGDLLVVLLNGIEVHSEAALYPMGETLDRIAGLLLEAYGERLGSIRLSPGLSLLIAAELTGFAVEEFLTT